MCVCVCVCVCVCFELPCLKPLNIFYGVDGNELLDANFNPNYETTHSNTLSLAPTEKFFPDLQYMTRTPNL